MNLRKRIVSAFFITTMLVSSMLCSAFAFGGWGVDLIGDSGQEVVQARFDIVPVSTSGYTCDKTAALDKQASGSAYYNVTGYSPAYSNYLNVLKTSASSTKVGTDKKISKAGTYYISYTGSNGKIDVSYSPAARLASSAYSGTCMSGYWRP